MNQTERLRRYTEDKSKETFLQAFHPITLKVKFQINLQ